MVRPGADFEPTPRRLATARARGDVAVSPILTGGLALVAGLLVVEVGGPGVWKTLATAIARGCAGDLGAEAAVGLVLAVAAPFVLVPAGAALVTGLAQTRGLVAAGGLRARRPGRPRAFLAVGIVAAAVVVVLVPWVPLLPRLAGASAALLVTTARTVLHRLLWTAALATLVAGAVDLLRAWSAHRVALRMTRAELARDRRDTDGDPGVRAERSRRGAEAAPVALAIVGAAGLDAIGLAFAPPVIVTPRVVLHPGPAAHTHVDARLHAALTRLSDGDPIPPALYEEVAALL